MDYDKGGEKETRRERERELPEAFVAHGYGSEVCKQTESVLTGVLLIIIFLGRRSVLLNSDRTSKSIIITRTHK